MLFGNKDKKRFKYWCLVVIFVVLGTLPRRTAESKNKKTHLEMMRFHIKCCAVDKNCF